MNFHRPRLPPSALSCPPSAAVALARPHCTQDKSKLSEDHLPGLAEIVGEEDVAKAVLKVPPYLAPYLIPI